MNLKIHELTDCLVSKIVIGKGPKGVDMVSIYFYRPQGGQACLRIRGDGDANLSVEAEEG